MNKNSQIRHRNHVYVVEADKNLPNLLYPPQLVKLVPKKCVVPEYDAYCQLFHDLVLQSVAQASRSTRSFYFN